MSRYLSIILVRVGLICHNLVFNSCLSRRDFVPCWAERASFQFGGITSKIMKYIIQISDYKHVPESEHYLQSFLVFLTWLKRTHHCISSLDGKVSQNPERQIKESDINSTSVGSTSRSLYGSDTIFDNCRSEDGLQKLSSTM